MKGIDMELKLVIFDVDGTLIDSENVWKNVMKEVGEKYGLMNLDKTLFPKVIGKSGFEEHEVYKQMIPDDIRENLIEEWRRVGFESLQNHIPIKKGLYEMLSFLKEKNIKIAIGTATDRTLTEERLSKINVIQDIDFSICGNEIRRKKPEPDIYLDILHHFHLDSKKAIVIEDSVVGVQAAYRAKIPCIQIPDIIPPTQEQYKQTIYIANDLIDAKNKIQELYF